jgi:hypothetical protein
VASLTRAELLRHGGGSAAIVLGGSALSFVPPARADTPSDGDLAYARLLVAAELLAIDFYRRALASKKFRPRTTVELRRLLADERKHYRAVAGTLRAAGQTAATAADIDFVYPRRAFSSRASTAALGARLESLLLGAYLGAVTGFEADALKLTAARVAASEAQHLSVFTGAASGQRIGPAFPRSLTIDRASAVLDTFTA